MLTTSDFKYYQPCGYSDDGTVIEYLGIPDGLFSFQAFRSEGECREWLKKNGYNPNEFVIVKYSNDDIEDMILIDADGNAIPKIEEFSDDEIENLITDEVLFETGSIDNLCIEKQDDETRDQFMDRVYNNALDKVTDAICTIEEYGDYDFSCYGGNPETEWYDGAQDNAVKVVMNWILDNYQE